MGKRRDKTDCLLWLFTTIASFAVIGFVPSPRTGLWAGCWAWLTGEKFDAPGYELLLGLLFIAALWAPVAIVAGYIAQATIAEFRKRRNAPSVPDQAADYDDRLPPPTG